MVTFLCFKIEWNRKPIRTQSNPSSTLCTGIHYNKEFTLAKAVSSKLMLSIDNTGVCYRSSHAYWIYIWNGNTVEWKWNRFIKIRLTRYSWYAFQQRSISLYKKSHSHHSILLKCTPSHLDEMALNTVEFVLVQLLHHGNKLLT